MSPRSRSLRFAWAAVAFCLSEAACSKPICAVQPGDPRCMATVPATALPTRVAWPLPASLSLAWPAGIHPDKDSPQLDLVAVGAVLDDCIGKPTAMTGMGMLELPVHPAPMLMPGPAEWVLRLCQLNPGSPDASQRSPELLRAPVRVYVPPQFAPAQLVTDRMPGAGTTVVDYGGVALGAQRIYAHENIRTTTAYRRLRPLSAEGIPIVLDNDDFLTVDPDRQVGVSQGAGLFPRIPAAMGSPSIDLELVPFTPRNGRHRSMLPADGLLLATDAGGDRVALVQASQLSMYAMAADNQSLSTPLGTCPLAGGIQPTAVAVARGSAHPVKVPVAGQVDAGMPAETRSPNTTAVVLDLHGSTPQVLACEEYLAGASGTGQPASVQLDEATRSCFQQALNNTTLKPVRIALADLDADGLLDLVAAPAEKGKKLFYVPAQIRSSDCSAIELPLEQPSSTPRGLAVGLTSQTPVVTGVPNSPFLPDLAVADPAGVYYFKRR